MKDEKTKIRLLLAGIALVLIVIIAGVSIISQKLNAKTDSTKLQSDIIQYAESTQSKEKEQAKEQDKEQDEEQDKAPESAGNEGVKDQATVIDPPPEPKAPLVDEAQEVMEETEVSQTPEKTSDKTTALWHVESTEKLDNEAVDLPRQMSEMKGYWEAGNMDAVKDLAYLPRYRAASLQLKGTTKYYYYGDTDANKRPNGKGLALYADNQYYYGDWVDGVRSGSGMWIKYFVYNEKSKASESLYLLHSYSGHWDRDLPNGEGSEHYDYIEGNMELNVGYNRNFIGSFKDGLYNGEIYITNYYSDGNVKEWSATADNGVWQPLGEKDKLGQYPVIVEKTDNDNYQWMKQKENKNQGINEIISAAKSK